MTTGLQFEIAQEIQPKHLSKLVDSGHILSEQVENIIFGINDTTEFLQGFQSSSNPQAASTLKSFVIREKMSGINIISYLYTAMIALNAGGILKPRFEYIPPTNPNVRASPNVQKLILMDKETDIILARKRQGEYSIYVNVR